MLLIINPDNEAIYSDGYWSAGATGHSIFTNGETLEELLENVEEAVRLYFEDEGGTGGQIANRV
ncbi:hypothetical protein DSECCO2_601290 [anaerobic digester metagenome]|jgi:predicted RNase H-like HicB family nuclease